MSEILLNIYIVNSMRELDRVEERITGLTHSQAIYDILEETENSERVAQKINTLKFIHRENWEIIFGNNDDNPFNQFC